MFEVQALVLWHTSELANQFVRTCYAINVIIVGMVSYGNDHGSVLHRLVKLSDIQKQTWQFYNRVIYILPFVAAQVCN